MTELRLRFFGVPEVSLDDRPLTFTRRRSLALLAYLAVTGRAHSRETLSTLLSADGGDAQAPKQLSNALAELRRLLGDYVVATRQTAAFNRALPHSLDVEAFHTAVKAWRNGGDASALEAAVEIHRADFLDGLSLPDAVDFDQWLTLQREELRGAAVQALHTIVDRAVRDRAYAHGLPAARRIVEMEPWSEYAQHRLMVLLGRTGQRRAALAQYEAYRQTLREETAEEPGPEITALYHRLRAAAVPPPHNLPIPATAFVGRATQVDMLVQRLADEDCRVLTLVGLGGSGKTRLALEVARAYTRPAAVPMEQPFPDGVFLVPLSDIAPAMGPGAATDAEAARRVFALVGGVLGINFDRTGDPAAQLERATRTSGVLLVLDGAERVQAGVEVLVRLLRVAPGVKLLVTSRAGLGVTGECIHEVGGLSLPATPSEVEESEAGALFLQEARRVAGPVPLDDEERNAVARICNATGGLPLALLLAAGRRRGMPARVIADELARSIDPLAASARDLPERHADVRRVLADAYDRLAPEEQAVLRGLAVFSPGFDAEAALAVTGATPSRLLALRKASVLTTDETGRYLVPELVRRYAAEELAARPQEGEDAGARHAAYYTALLQRRTTALLRSEQEVDIAAGDAANIRAAWEWSARRVQVDLIGDMRTALTLWYELTGRYDEAVEAFGRAVDRLRERTARDDAADPLLHVVLQTMLTEQARFLVRRGEYDRAKSLLEGACDVMRSSPDARTDAYPAFHSAGLLRAHGDSGAGPSRR